MKKATTIKAINEMPDDFDLELLIKKLVFLEKVEDGLFQLEDGKIVPHEGLKELVKKW
jgi:hypothetical protein